MTKTPTSRSDSSKNHGQSNQPPFKPIALRLLGDISKNLDKIDKTKVEEVFLVVMGVPVIRNGSTGLATVSAYQGQASSTHHPDRLNPATYRTDEPGSSSTYSSHSP